MSFDLAVWKADDPGLTDSDAGKIFLQLCDGAHEGWPAAPEVEAFYRELTQRYPELDDLPEEEVDNCPWSARLDRSAHHVIMTVVWSRADEIRSVVLDLAGKHSLLLFDPQEGKIIRPPRPAKRHWFKF
ncbi:MAG: hypothetical protein ABSE45_17375 [Candidatus Acidiferrales bacterium]|jgi:hypothetical protein